MKVKAYRIYEQGDISVMKWEDVNVPEPGKGEVRLRHTAIGFNLIDTYRRKGVYPVPLPTGLGSEAVGVVESIGTDVDIKIGTRVGYISGPNQDSYSEARIIPADRLFPIPDSLEDTLAAAVLLKGVTAEYLLCRASNLASGDIVLFHAAAGGVGLIFCQWARALGITVIGTVSTKEKAAIATKYGCTHTIITSEEDFEIRVKELTDGKGVDVVFDSIGKDTINSSLACLKRRGTLVSFGSASGNPDPIDLVKTGLQGSPFITRAMLMNYASNREEILNSTSALFAAVKEGWIKVHVGQRYSLKDAPNAHKDAEDRKTTGSTVLIP